MRPHAWSCSHTIIQESCGKEVAFRLSAAQRQTDKQTHASLAVAGVAAASAIVKGDQSTHTHTHTHTPGAKETNYQEYPGRAGEARGLQELRGLLNDSLSGSAFVSLLLLRGARTRACKSISHSGIMATCSRLQVGQPPSACLRKCSLVPSPSSKAQSLLSA